MKLLTNYKKIVYDECAGVENFMSLLMKQRNRRGKWTKEEINKIVTQLKRLTAPVPSLIVFLSPFGFLMLPFLARLLDRRSAIRCR